MLFNIERSAGRILAIAAAAVATIAIFSATSAFAQQAKVVKVQGKKAIVQFPDEARPRVGQILEIGNGSGVSMSGGSTGTSTGARDMIVGGGAELSSLTVSGAAASTTRFGVDARFGWNVGQMEYGGIGTVGYSTTTGSSSRQLAAGGFFDYNLVPNTPGTEIVYGGAVLGKFGSIGSTSGSAEVTGTVMDLELGGQLKWFPLGTSVAVRGDLLYRIQSASDTVKASPYAGGSGLVARGGFYIYF